MAPWLRASLRRAGALAVVFASAKACLLLIRVIDGHGGPLRSGWTPFAFLYQDVWALCAFAALDLGLAQAFRRSASATSWSGRLLWALYLFIAGYVAFNVPVARVFGTPLTYSILGAAGGALKDSIVVYLTTANILAIVVVLGLALVAPSVLGRLRRPRVVWWSLAFAGLCLVLGPIGARRIECLGLHRNALVTLVRTTWAQKGPFRRALDASVADVPIAPSGTALDLSHLSGAARGKHVMWVILESTGARYLKPYGAAADPMPNLTRLVEHGLRFESAYAVYPESIKGLYSMICSFAPAPHTDASKYAPDKLPCSSVAQTFRAAGYRTGFFHSGRFVYLGMEHIVKDRGFDRLDDAGAIGGKFVSSFGVDDASTARQTLAFIDARKPGEKFFAVYSNISGHHPYETPGEGARPFGEGTDLQRYQSDLYRGDLALGLLVEGLASRGLLQDTLWIIHGDHGEAFFQHEGNFAHTLFVYEENVHIPLFVVLPGALDRAVAAPQIASLLDLAPTMVDLAGLSRPSTWQGQSLLAPTARVARFYTDHAVWQAGLRDGSWKFIHEVDSGRTRLFDLRADPGEMHDLSSAQPDRVDLYRRHLASWQAHERALVDR